MSNLKFRYFIMNSKYKNIAIYTDDALVISSIAKNNKITTVEIFSIITKIIKENQHIIFAESLVPIYDTDKLTEEFRKKVTKENNRILGFYLQTEKLIKRMYRDMHYLLESDEKEKKMKHPFWSEYELQNSIIRRFLLKKMSIQNDEDLIKSMLEVLSKNEVDDYIFALNRTREKRLSNI